MKVIQGKLTFCDYIQIECIELEKMQEFYTCRGVL
jgi:hypothetical protein